MRCARARGPPDVRTVVFRGAGGRAFAAGNEISGFSLTEGADGVAYEAKVGRVLRAVAELPQVTLAAVDGICVGGGRRWPHATCGSARGVAVRLIARTLGNALSAFIVYRCAAVFGESLTREMLLTSRLVTAERAYAVGAVMAVLPSEELDAEVDRVVDGIEAARRSPRRDEGAAAAPLRRDRGVPGRRPGPAREGLRQRGLPGGRARLPGEESPGSGACD